MDQLRLALIFVLADLHVGARLVVDRAVGLEHRCHLADGDGEDHARAARGPALVSLRRRIGREALSGRRRDRRAVCAQAGSDGGLRSEEHTSELQSLMRISYAVFCLKKQKETQKKKTE